MIPRACPTCTAWIEDVINAGLTDERRGRECPDCGTVLHLIDERGRRPSGRIMTHCVRCKNTGTINIDIPLADAVVVAPRPCPDCRDRALLLESLALVATTSIAIPYRMRAAALEQLARVRNEWMKPESANSRRSRLRGA